MTSRAVGHVIGAGSHHSFAVLSRLNYNLQSIDLQLARKIVVVLIVVAAATIVLEFDI